MKNGFLPTRDGDLNSLEENFLNKLSTYAATLGLDPNEVVLTRSIIDAHKNAFAVLNSKKAEARAATEENALHKTAAKKELRRIAARIKASPAYTSAIGDDMGIIGSVTTEPPMGEVKPKLKANVIGNEVILKFRKNGTNGVKIFSRRGTESEFTLLATYLVSPYSDVRAKLEADRPEAREYYAIHIVNDKEVGVRSDIIKVTVA